MPPLEPSLTLWNRLVMGQRTPTVETGLEARLHDPMWMLARQFQLGEFLGEDAGSPVAARVRARITPLTRYYPDSDLRPGDDVVGELVDGRTRPLEPLVEGEPVHSRAEPSPRVAVESGLRLLRSLRKAGLGGYTGPITAAFPLPVDEGGDLSLPDPASERYLRLMRGRVPDGRTARAAFAPPAGPGTWSWPAGLAVAAADETALRSCLAAWVTWYDTQFDEPGPDSIGSAWDPQRQEYRFTVAGFDGATESAFTAGSYHGGRLDWDALRAAPGVSLGATADAAATGATLLPVTVPAPLTYAGMPATRWWEMEDAAVDFGVDGADDLVRMLFTEFLFGYANDWYVIPVELPYGTFVKVTSLVVTDVFGVRTTVQAVAGDDWRMYTPTGADDGLLLPPVLADGMESDPIEEVRFLRDENANLAWGIEHLVEGPAGLAVNRHEVSRAGRTAAPAADAPTGAQLRYRLATEVPPHWIPFVPVREDGTLRLQRGQIPADVPGEPSPSRPLGRILEPERDRMLVFDEEVPRSGLRVTRAYQHARDPDGSVRLWLGRRRRPAAHGEARSGLCFDTTEPVSTEN